MSKSSEFQAVPQRVSVGPPSVFQVISRSSSRHVLISAPNEFSGICASFQVMIPTGKVELMVVLRATKTKFRKFLQRQLIKISNTEVVSRGTIPGISREKPSWKGPPTRQNRAPLLSSCSTAHRSPATCNGSRQPANVSSHGVQPLHVGALPEFFCLCLVWNSAVIAL